MAMKTEMKNIKRRNIEENGAGGISEKRDNEKTRQAAKRKAAWQLSIGGGVA
jgi:hypothetical protein